MSANTTSLKFRRKDQIRSYYEERMGKGLPEFQVLGWESEEAQKIRFDILLEQENLQHRKLLDVGCGFGNLLEYIEKKGIETDYVGVDILKTMVAIVKKKGLQGSFYCLDLFKECPFADAEFDVVYTSGIFNLNLENNLDFLAKALKLFFRLSKRTVAFNLLSYQSKDQEDKYFYYHPKDVVQIIHAAYPQPLSIDIYEGYLQNDFTVICKKV